MMRVSMAESERFPQQSALYFDVLFTQVQARVSAYLKATFRLSAKASADAASSLLGQVLFPRFSRVLFGLDLPMQSLDANVSLLSSDLKQTRKAVSDVLDRLMVKA